MILDTSVLIELRDDGAHTAERVEALGRPLSMSILSRIELENGVVSTPNLADRAERRLRLAELVAAIPALIFDSECADAYRLIVETTGFSRRQTLDRMIAAQALVRGATLVTLNGRDFRDVPGLKLLEW